MRNYRKIVKIRRVGETLVVTLPKEIVEGLNLKKGQRVMISVCEHNILTITKED